MMIAWKQNSFIHYHNYDTQAVSAPLWLLYKILQELVLGLISLLP